MPESWMLVFNVTDEWMVIWLGWVSFRVAKAKAMWLASEYPKWWWNEYISKICGLSFKSKLWELLSSVLAIIISNNALVFCKIKDKTNFLEVFALKNEFDLNCKVQCISISFPYSRLVVNSKRKLFCIFFVLIITICICIRLEHHSSVSSMTRQPPSQQKTEAQSDEHIQHLRSKDTIR